MKNVFITVLLVGFFGIGLVGECGFSGYKFTQDFLNNSLKNESWNFKIFRWCYNGLPFMDRLDTLLSDKAYLVLFQNNHELRPSGGFMGSYAKLKTQNSGLASFAVQDIYVPDGQIAGHIDPPLPIQQAFGQGWWKLRDSNWDPDFTVAAPQIAWFFNQGGETVDGLIVINLSLVEKILQLFGEIQLTDYLEKITAKTFYDLAQKYAEVGFFPGSTQKRDFLGAVGNALMDRIINSTPYEKLKLAKLVWQQLKQGEILLWFKDPNLQQVVTQRDWDGSLGTPTGDYLYIVETNLGANKANCCVIRQVIQEINGNQEKVTINYQNNNPFQNPKPPYFWGGNYINYLRIIVPAGAEVQRVKVAEKELEKKLLDNQYGIQEDRYQVDERDKFKIVGFWAVVPAQSSTAVELEYKSGRVEEREYGILVKHQPGMGGFDYKLMANGKLVLNSTIDQDHEFNVER